MRYEGSNTTYVTRETCDDGLQCLVSQTIDIDAITVEQRDGNTVLRCLTGRKGSAADGMRRSAILTLLFHILWSSGW